MSVRLTQRWLEREYRRLNRICFGGALPKDTELRWVERFPGYPRRVGMTGTYRAANGSKYGPISGFCIKLSRRTERFGLAEVGLTLLHEMAHVATWRQCNRRSPHGRAWVREMRRLAAEGHFDRLW